MQHLQRNSCSIYSRSHAAFRACQNRKDRRGTTQNVDLILAAFTAEMLQHLQHNFCIICSAIRAPFAERVAGEPATVAGKPATEDQFFATFIAEFLQHLQHNFWRIKGIPKRQRHTGNETKRAQNYSCIRSTFLAAFTAKYLQHLQQQAGRHHFTPVKEVSNFTIFTNSIWFIIFQSLSIFTSFHVCLHL